jgi:hypothetical protein
MTTSTSTTFLAQSGNMSTAQKNIAAFHQVQAIKEVAKADPRDVIIAKADDWTAMYVDGRKIIENHVLTEDEIFRALGISVREVWVDHEWLYENGNNFPPTATELPY